MHICIYIYVYIFTNTYIYMYKYKYTNKHIYIRISRAKLREGYGYGCECECEIVCVIVCVYNVYQQQGRTTLRRNLRQMKQGRKLAGGAATQWLTPVRRSLEVFHKIATISTHCCHFIFRGASGLFCKKVHGFFPPRMR